MNTAPQHRERKRLSAGWLVVGLPALLVSYVLSIGPAARLARDGRIEISTWQGAYLPLLIATDHSSPVYELANWYIGHWGVIFLELSYWGAQEYPPDRLFQEPPIIAGSQQSPNR